MKADSPRIRVSLVEDDRAWREDLEALIRGTPSLCFAGAHPNAEAALRQLPAEAPDVVLMDLQLPHLSGTDCVSRLKPLLPRTQFVMLSAFEDSEQILQALRAGATGYLTKSAAPASIRDAIVDAHRGGSPMSPHIARKVVASFHPDPAASGELAKLTGREREILHRLAVGDRYKEIADGLGISVFTVRTHIRHIYDKLHVCSRTEAIRKLLVP